MALNCYNIAAGINDTSNGMAMRSDIRRCFDGTVSSSIHTGRPTTSSTS